MSKSHRDNVKARKKIGEIAYEKKKARRDPNKKKQKCSVCGRIARRTKMKDGVCPVCMERTYGHAQ